MVGVGQALRVSDRPRRADLRVRRRPLHGPPDPAGDDWLARTPAGRVAAVWPLALSAWAVMGPGAAAVATAPMRRDLVAVRRIERR